MGIKYYILIWYTNKKYLDFNEQNPDETALLQISQP